MTPLETALLGAGLSLLAFYAVRTALPTARGVVDAAAARRSEALRMEFVRLTAPQARRLLLWAGTILAAAAAAATRSAAWALASAAAPMLLSGIAVRRYAVRRKKRVIAQLPAFIDAVCGHLKAGHSLPESLARLQETLPPAIRDEVAWIVRMNQLGTPLPECLSLWEARIPAEEIALLARPLAAALPAGGNVVELLGRTRDILRMRHRAAERLRSMTAQARLQAGVLTLLPPAFAAAIAAVDPEYLPRILGTPQGQAILAASGFLQIAGWIVIRKILSERA